MKITEEFLIEKGASEANIDWWKRCGFASVHETLKVIHVKNFDYVNFLIRHCFTREQSLKVAIFSAAKVAHLSSDKRVQEALDAAKRTLDDDTQQNRIEANHVSAAIYIYDKYDCATARFSALAAASTAATGGADVDINTYPSYAVVYATYANPEPNLKKAILNFCIEVTK